MQINKGPLKREYSSWSSMKERCSSPKHPSYKNYGARGISVCDRWVNSFQNFLEDMGRRPDGTTLGRINNDLGYSPENCRWETWAQQAANRRPMCEEAKRASAERLMKCKRGGYKLPPRSEEHRAKIAANMTGHQFPEECKRKISESLKRYHAERKNAVAAMEYKEKANDCTRI